MTTWEPGFNPSPVQSRFVLDNVVMGQDFSMYFGFPLLVPLRQCFTLIHCSISVVTVSSQVTVWHKINNTVETLNYMRSRCGWAGHEIFSLVGASFHMLEHICTHRNLILSNYAILICVIHKIPWVSLSYQPVLLTPFEGVGIPY